VGFSVQAVVPRSVRRAVHPVRTAKRAATPKAVKRVTRAMHPLDNATYGVERSVATSLRSGQKRKQRRKGGAPVYRHGTCPVAPHSRRSGEVPQPLTSSKWALAFGPRLRCSRCGM
jgi:hypothetical protein